MPRVAVNRTQEWGNFLRVRNGGKVLLPRWRQGPTKITARVTLCPACGDRISEDLSGDSPNPVRRLQCAAALDATEHRQQLRRLDVLNRLAADPRKQVPLHPAPDRDRMAGRPLREELRVPLPAYGLE